jgi:hypothetical protein
MQLISVYLYPNKLDVFTNSLADWTQERYRQVYQRNLKIYRGVDNRIDFQVKNAAQKPLDITNGVFVFTLVSRETQELLLTKVCDVRSFDNGRIYVDLTEAEVRDIEPGFYQFSLVQEVHAASGDTYAVTSRKPLYFDSQYDAVGTMEVVGNIYGEPVPSQVIKEFSESVPEIFTDPNYFTSSIINAHPNTSTGSSTHTFQLYFTDFSGRITLEGSLEESASPLKWATVPNGAQDYVGATLEYLNVIGKYNWFRFVVRPNDSESFGDFTVDLTLFGYYNVTLNRPGKNYTVGNTILIKGNRLGGEAPTHDLTITITGVDQNGGITSFTHSGLSYNGVSRFQINNSDGTNVGTVDKILYR